MATSKTKKKNQIALIHIHATAIFAFYLSAWIEKPEKNIKLFKGPHYDEYARKGREKDEEVERLLQVCFFRLKIKILFSNFCRSFLENLFSSNFIIFSDRKQSKKRKML